MPCMLLVSGPDAGNAEGSEAVPGKALPPWLLRQGITSTSSAAGGQGGTPLLQAGVGASAGAAISGEAVLSEEEDQKRIEVCYRHCYSYTRASIRNLSQRWVFMYIRMCGVLYPVL